MSNPAEILVRLTPAGLKEVLDGIRQLRQESEKAGRQSRQGLTLLGDAARDLKQLLPQIGLAATGFAILSISKRALDAADATGKLQQKVGGVTEEISGLTHAFVTNNSSQDDLQQLLITTSRRMEELRAGVPETADAFARIGISVEDLKGRDAPRVLELIASRLANIPDGATKAALATDVFNKNAANLIPALNAVGSQGIDPFIESARRAGVLVGSELADAAARANDAFQLMTLQAQGTAQFFLSGFLPPIADAMEAFNEAIENDGISPLRSFGTFLGWVLKTVTFVVATIGKLIGASFAVTGAQIRNVVDALTSLATLDLDGARAAIKRFFTDTLTIAKSYTADIADDYEKLATPPAPKATDRPRVPVLPAVNQVDNRIAQARQAFLKSQLQNELSITKSHLNQLADANEQAFKAGLISLSEYFKRRRELADKEAAAELENLRAQRRAILQTELAQINELTRQREAIRSQALGGQRPAGAAPGATPPQTATLDADLEARRLKLREQVADLDAKIQVRELEHQRTLKQLEAEQITAQRQSTQEQIQAFNTLDELEGRRHSVFLRNLTVEARELREVLTRAGAGQPEIDDQVRRLQTARTAQFDFEEVARRGKAALDAFNRDADQIRRDQEAGVIGQIEGEDRLIELERKRLEVLRAIAAQQLLAAEKTGVPELITQAQQYADSVAAIEASYKGATDVVAQFKQGVSESFRSGTKELLLHTEEIHSLEDAFKSLGDTILQTLRNISAEIISKQLTKGFESLLGIGAAGTGGGGGAGFWASLIGAFSGARRGGLIRAASGGLIQGPGTGTSDSVLAVAGDRRVIRVSNREFIIRNKVVEQPGALQFLRDFNARGMPAVHAAPRFAAGGLVGFAPPTNVAGMGRASRRTSESMPLRIYQTIQAPDRETGRRTATQAGAAVGRAVSDAARRNN